MTTLDVGRIRSSRPEVLLAAAQGLERCRLDVEAVVIRLLRGRARGWSGPAAAAAAAQAAALVAGLGRLGACLAASSICLGQAADRVRTAQDLLSRADERAAADGAWVDHEGTLFLPVRAAGLDPVLEAYQARRDVLLREEVHTYLRQAVRLAADVDARLAADLLAAARGGPAAAPVLAAGGVLPVPAPPVVLHDASGAYASAAWWRCLTDAERRSVVRDHPQWLGPRDGIPATARHEANLALLAEAERAAAAALAAERDQPANVLGVDVLAPARRRVEDLRAVRAVLGRRDGVLRRLLFLDARGSQVKVVVAQGDVDTAEHVVTFVGGLSTKARDDLERYDDWFTPLRQQALREGEGADTAIVTWMGYEAPQPYEIVTSRDRSVLNPKIARDNADELAAFVTGLGAARDEPVHQTVWAHSYGSVLAGNALLLDSPIDDVAVFGSPGVPFDRIERTGLKAGSFNVLEGGHDVVAHPGWPLFGRHPDTVSGAVSLSTTALKDPTAPCNLWRGIGSGADDPSRTSAGHTQYLRAGTVSTDNLVAVAVGRRDLVVQQTPVERSCITMPTMPPPPAEVAIRLATSVAGALASR
ncbi:alpha/beta hydrolase [Intrasporangium sp. YIM S08009]|uniref:alpha/beta hydrolase n=1 Tax=Intrasporangium zincisolvens TaxID=3080018 RepID=UPI002B05AA5C|nr:alpha/beta hydrolase [Intrasporangium sp. YIM S08009]